jgi:hypothetical protein
MLLRPLSHAPPYRRTTGVPATDTQVACPHFPAKPTESQFDNGALLWLAWTLCVYASGTATALCPSRRRVETLLRHGGWSPSHLLVSRLKGCDSLAVAVSCVSGHSVARVKVVDFCESGNVPQGSIQCGAFLEWLERLLASKTLLMEWVGWIAI